MKGGLLLIVGIALIFLISINSYSLLTDTITSNSLNHNKTQNVHGTNYYYIYPPKINPQLSNVKSPLGVNVYAGYKSEPAPMGIADYGIGPNGPYIRNTSQVLAKAYIRNLYVDSSLGTNSISAQLNVVLSYCYQGHNYAIWLQDVAMISLCNNFIKFIDNIWNLSEPFASIENVVGKGHICNYRGISFYYYCANNYPGSPATFTLPLKFCVLINVSVNSLGEPVVYFWYNDGYGWVNYDTVTFLYPGSKDVNITINGYQYTGSGNFYDIEFDIVGPGGGSCAYFYSSCISLYLYYWNGHNFQEVRNAFNFGSNTAETSNNVIARGYYNTSDGELFSKLTAGQGSLYQIWSSNQVSTVRIHTNISKGYVSFSTSKWCSKLPEYKFCGNCATVTLYPGNYSIVILNSQGNVSGESYVSLVGGKQVVTYCYHLKIIMPSSICIFCNKQNTVYFEICGMGYATLSLKLPSYITFYDNFSSFINGKEIVKLVLVPQVQYPSGLGVITVTLSSGISCSHSFTLVSGVKPINVLVKIITIGNLMHSQLKIKVTFPNGTTSYILPCVEYLLPYNTEYCLPSCVYENNQIRWILNSSNSGVFESQGVYVFYYYEEYLVNFSFKVVGQNYSNFTPEIYYCSLGKIVEGKPGLLWADYNSTYRYQQCINYGEMRFISYDYYGKVNSFNVEPVYYQQFYINVKSPFPLYALVNGYNESFTSGWYNYSTNIHVENITYYPCKFERYVIISIMPKECFKVDSPVNVSISYIIQFYVEIFSRIPIYAEINGINESLVSGWYNKGSDIIIENITYYPCKFERDIITSVSPSMSIIVNSPVNVSISYITQFYVNVSSRIPIYALVNGTNTTLISGWYNKGTAIYVENVTYYPYAGTRCVIISVSNPHFTVENHTVVVVSTVRQFLVYVTSPIPVKAYVNGKEVLLNSTWINAGSKIQIINYTYYVCNNERFIITKISPSVTFFLLGPSHVTLCAIKQYAVTINGVTTWYNQGSKIKLNASIPIYEVGKFVGTYNVSPGSCITVNSPIQERLVESINYLFVGIIAFIIIVIAILGIVIIKRR